MASSTFLSAGDGGPVDSFVEALCRRESLPERSKWTRPAGVRSTAKRRSGDRCPVGSVRRETNGAARGGVACRPRMRTGCTPPPGHTRAPGSRACAWPCGSRWGAPLGTAGETSRAMRWSEALRRFQARLAGGFRQMVKEAPSPKPACEVTDDHRSRCLSPGARQPASLIPSEGLRRLHHAAPAGGERVCREWLAAGRVGA